MTVFEQTIDTSQVQMGPSLFGSFLILTIWLAITIVLAVLLVEKTPRIMKRNPAIFILSLALVVFAGLVGPIFAMAYIPPAKALS